MKESKNEENKQMDREGGKMTKQGRIYLASLVYYLKLIKE